MKAEEVLDILVLLQGLWPHRPLTMEIAERLAGHFSKMNHRQVRVSLLSLSDTMKFPPSFAEVRSKVRELELAGHFRIKAQGRQKVKPKAERDRIENRKNELRYQRDNGKITREEFDSEMKKIGEGATRVGEVLETAFGGRFKEYAVLGRRLIKGEINREEYESERKKLDDSNKA